MDSPDKNILKLAEHLKQIHKIPNKQFAVSIGLNPTNINKIKNSEKNPDRNYHFTLEQIRKVGEVYKVDMNYIFGFTDKMYRE
ncbi:hypothetical protein [Epilithonimonas caeni]|uniref:hypothetical protein n=1 Tax=Epilithonimonas caeni TaxID=365343 RepID=UPI000412DBC3|nr:hypothetical protein [Epilithonimonas caeni]